MTVPSKQSKAAELLVQQTETLSGIANVKKFAEKLFNNDPNKEYTEKLHSMKDVIKLNESHRPTMTYWKGQIISVLAKIKVGTDLETIRPRNLATSVGNSGVSTLTPSEHTAIREFDILIDQGGPAAREFTGQWNGMVMQALDVPTKARKGKNNKTPKNFAEKTWNHIKENKKTYAVLAVAGIVGLFLWKYLDSKPSGGNKSDKKGGGGFFSTKNKVLMGLGVMVAGSVAAAIRMDKKTFRTLLSWMGADQLVDLLKLGDKLDKDQIKDAENALKKKGGKIKGGAKKVAKNTQERLKRQKESAAYSGMKIGLINFYCLNDYRHSSGDIGEISSVFDQLMGKKMSTILPLWEKNKNSSTKTITDLAGLPIKNVQPKNIYAAITIIGKSFEIHKKHIGAHTGGLKLKDFLVQLAKDPTYKINNKIQKSLALAITERDPSKINFKGIGEVFKEKRKEYITNLATKLDINLEGMTKDEKDDFYSIIVGLYTNSNININADQALLSMKGKEPKAYAAGVKFFNAVKSNAEKIKKACGKIFNISGPAIKPENNDILKRSLGKASMRFKYAFQLNILANDPDLKKTMSYPKKVALLFIILQSIPEKDKFLYLSELSRQFLLSKSNLKLTHLYALKPYFNKLANFAKESAEDTLNKTEDATSAYTQGSSPGAKKAFAQKMRDSDYLEYGSALAGSTTAGTLQIGKRAWYSIINTLIATADITAKDIQNSTTDKGFLSLIFKAGGVILFGKEGRRQELGLIRLAGEEFVFRPVGVLLDSLKAMASGGSEKNSAFWTGFKMYTIGVAPYIVIGAVGSKAFGYSAIGGAKRGFFAPATVPMKIGELSWRGGRWTQQLGLTGYNLRRDIKKYGIKNALPAKNLRMFLRETRLTDHFYRHRELGRTRIQALRSYWDNTSREIKRKIAPHYYDRMTNSSAIRLANFHNEYLNLEEGARRYISLDKITSANAINSNLLLQTDRIQRFFLLIKNHPDYSNRATTAQMTKIMNEVVLKSGLPSDYLDLFLEKVKGKNLKIFHGMMEDASGELKKIATEQSKKPKASHQSKGPGSQTKFSIPKKIANNQWRFRGQEMNILDSDVAKMAAKRGVSMELAAARLCHARWNTPTQFGADIRGHRIYQYRGGEFSIPKAEYVGKSPAQIKKLCEAKFLKSIKIHGYKRINGKITQIKVGNKWVKIKGDPRSMAQAMDSYLLEMKKAGKSIEFKDLKHTKLLKYFSVLKKIVGPAVAAGMIYHLETAPDKRLAAAETIMSLAVFMGAAKGGAWTAAKLNKNPIFVGIAGLASGMITAIGVHEPINKLIKEYWPRFAGMQHMSVEGISFFEKATARSLTRTALRSASSGVLKKGLNRVGLKVIGNTLNKQISTKVLKKVATFASQKLLKKISVSLGVKGAIMAATLADDVTVIGVLDNFIPLGMAVWMAKDIYDIVVLSKKAFKIKNEMSKRSALPIENLEPATVKDQKTLEAAFVNSRKPFKEMSTQEIMSVVNSIADIRLKITRKGIGGYEEYHYVKGEVFSTTIVDENGEKVELSDKELNQDIKLPPPKEFKPWEIDYNQPKEQLLANYQYALLRTKSELGWTKVDHEIIDDKTIIIKRLDGNQEISIKRTGATWQVGEYKSGLTLFQAVAVANLVGKVKGIFKKEDHRGASDRPFQIDGDDIDFDRNWNPIDLSILSGDTGWATFYKKMGLSQNDLVDVLNDWYQLEYHHVVV